MLTGAMWLIPSSIASWGTWLVGIGLILVGINVARLLNHIRVGRFTTILGLMLLSLGIAYLMGAQPPLIPVVIVPIGASIIFSALISSRRGNER